jgi:CopG family transcriptional regulator, nickel-responsive regulator
MTIVSLSLPEVMIKDMDKVQDSLGFTGRSELVRSGIRLLLQEVKEKTALAGEVTAVIVVTHAEENEQSVTRIKHRYDDIIKTHVHNKVSRNNCVELFLLEGQGSKVASMANSFQKDDEIRTVKLVTV